VAPELTTEQLERSWGKGGQADLASHFHDFSHGIISDPLALFAITFSALIHDADHRGVSNQQLAKEDPDVAHEYRNQSIAEQNSLDVTWNLLMLDQFQELRSFIFGTQSELLRFRHFIVNIVLATDIFDKELNELRTSRWVRAFSSEQPGQHYVNDLRATIVMEHIIQASDVSHTMQHWHVYRKWNRQLFQELYVAYQAGRVGSIDPSTFWYQGEIGFFDNYVIPLAKKLKECNVFGVSSEEYLNYALLNRSEWHEKGMDLVQEMVEEMSGSIVAN
jgi:3'5'-cyclic nucleotide phosphodiesterase